MALLSCFLNFSDILRMFFFCCFHLKWPKQRRSVEKVSAAGGHSRRQTFDGNVIEACDLRVIFSLLTLQSFFDLLERHAAVTVFTHVFKSLSWIKCSLFRLFFSFFLIAYPLMRNLRFLMRET